MLPKDRKLFYFRLASLIVWDDRFFPGSSSFLKLLTANLLRSESLEQLNGPEITYLLFLCTLQGPCCTLSRNLLSICQLCVWVAKDSACTRTGRD